MEPPRAVAYDTETTGLDIYRGDRVFAFASCENDGGAKIWRIDREGFRESRDACRALWFEDDRPVVMHNAIFDIGATKTLGIEPPRDREMHDTMIMSHLLQPHAHRHGLKHLAWTLAGYSQDDEKAVSSYGRYDRVPAHLMDAYQRGDVERTLLLFLFFWPKIMARPRYPEIYDVERELLWVTQRMEERGLLLNRPATEGLIAMLGARLVEIDSEVARIAGHPINLGSYPQVAHLLYRERGLPILEKTSTGNPSTGKDVLRRLQQEEGHKDPIIDLVIEYRSILSGRGTVSGYLDLADDEGVVHPRISTCGARTGRESCSSPNLQNVRKTGQLREGATIPARRCFRPRPGYVNLHYDYAGIEMRLIVHYSGDEEMTRLFREGKDPHYAAAQIFYERSDPTKSQRDAAKNANYAIGYGGAIPKLADILMLPAEQVARGYEEYRRRFPGVADFANSAADEVREEGSITTAFGRELIPDVEKPYTGANYLIQGTAAGVLKRTQVRLERYLREMTGDESRLLLPIHDEVVTEYPRNRLANLREIDRAIRELMTDFDFAVPLEVDCEVSTSSWEETRELIWPKQRKRRPARPAGRS